MMSRPKIRVTPVKIALFCILFVVTTGAIVTYKIFSEPAHGHDTHTITKIPPKVTTQAPKAEVPASTDVNDYYTVALPTGYRQQSPGAATAGALFTQSYLKSSGDGSHIIVVAINTLPAAGVSDLSSYRLRSESGSSYTRSTKVIHGETVELFSDSHSSSVVAFWQHAGKVASIGSSNGLQDMTDDGNLAEFTALQPILDGWQWK